MKNSKPSFKKAAFTCPHCGVYSTQEWYFAVYGQTFAGIGGTANIPSVNASKTDNINLCKCLNCLKYTVWYRENIIYPLDVYTSPEPHKDMPVDVIMSYEKARNVFDREPSASAAFLRLAVQQLMVHLGEKGENINKDISNLVQKNRIDGNIQKAMDSLRVIGNNAVHPGVIDTDDRDTAMALFELLNLIVMRTLGEDELINSIFSKIPDNTKVAIERRDKRQ